MSKEFRLNLKEKTFFVKREEKGWTIGINNKSLFFPEEKLHEILALLDCAFYGILKENTSIQADNGYLVLLRGQDKWGIRIGKEEREVIYLTRVDLRNLFYFFLLS